MCIFVLSTRDDLWFYITFNSLRSKIQYVECILFQFLDILFTAEFERQTVYFSKEYFLELMKVVLMQDKKQKGRC